MVRRIALSVALAGLAASCQLVIGIPDRGPLSDGGADAPAEPGVPDATTGGEAGDGADGGAEASDDAAGDAVGDSATDGGVIDAPAGGDGATDGGCSCPTLGGTPILCTGFDDGQLGAFAAHATGGSVTVDTSRVLTPPDALHVVVDQGADASTAAAWAEYDLAQTVSNAELVFDLYIDPYDYAVGMDNLYPVWLGIGQNASVFYVVQNGVIKEQEWIGSPTFAYEGDTGGSPGVFQQQQWTTIDFVVHAATNPPTFTLKMAPHGQPLATQFDEPFNVTTGWGPGPLSAILGAKFVNSAAAQRSEHYDDVVLCAQ